MPGASIEDIHYVYKDEMSGKQIIQLYKKQYLLEWRKKYHEWAAQANRNESEVVKDYQYKFCR